MTRTVNLAVPAPGKVRRALAAAWTVQQAMESTGLDHTLDRIEHLEREMARLKDAYPAAMSLVGASLAAGLYPMSRFDTYTLSGFDPNASVGTFEYLFFEQGSQTGANGGIEGLR